MSFNLLLDWKSQSMLMQQVFSSHFLPVHVEPCSVTPAGVWININLSRLWDDLLLISGACEESWAQTPPAVVRPQLVDTNLLVRTCFNWTNPASQYRFVPSRGDSESLQCPWSNRRWWRWSAAQRQTKQADWPCSDDSKKQHLVQQTKNKLYNKPLLQRCYLVLLGLFPLRCSL